MKPNNKKQLIAYLNGERFQDRGLTLEHVLFTYHNLPLFMNNNLPQSGRDC